MTNPTGPGWLKNSGNDAEEFSYGDARVAKPNKKSLRKIRPIGLSKEWDSNPVQFSDDALVIPHTKSLVRTVIEFIDKSEAIVGCVAWLSEKKILAALAEIPTCVVINKIRMLKKLQKASRSTGEGQLKAAYDALWNDFRRTEFPPPLKDSFHPYRENDWWIDPIVCVGRVDGANYAKMHHKFLVGMDLIDDQLVPARVLIGSFNFTYTARLSHESFVVIRDSTVADFFFREFSRVAAVSEPLNWQHQEPTPFYTAR